MKKRDVYQIDENTFITAIKDSTNVHEALVKMGLNSRGAAYTTFRLRCKKLDVDLSHFVMDKKIRKELRDSEILLACSMNTSLQSTLKTLRLNPHSNSNVRWLKGKIQKCNYSCKHWTGQAHLRNKTHSWGAKKPLNEILILNSTYLWNASLKLRLLKDGILQYKCYSCGISEWNGSKISLQLEHKNGNNVDNREENLSLLCPNCHSQTATFAGRNIGRQDGT